LTIHKKNLRSTVVALAFGAFVTVLPASADTITLSTTAYSNGLAVTTANGILVGGFDWTFGGSAGSTNVTGSQTLSSGVTFSGNTLATEIGGIGATGNALATALQSQVIDFKVTPTIAGGTAAAVDFQGTIQESTGGVYSLYFGANGSTGCTNVSVSCFSTGNGNVVNNGQSVLASGYTLLNSNGVNYEVATNTILTSKGAFLNGFVGAVVAPEPATYATTGLAAAFLGLFLSRKKKTS
jgi:hypothetical protein